MNRRSLDNGLWEERTEDVKKKDKISKIKACLGRLEIEIEDHPKNNSLCLQCYLKGVIDGMSDIGVIHVLANIDLLSRRTSVLKRFLSVI